MRSKYEVYEDYKYEGIEVSVTVPPEFHIRKNKDIFLFLEYQIQRQSIVMKMDITLYTKAIDTVLIIPIQSGIKKKLNTYWLETLLLMERV